jgi:cold-inducible RNA-binding protein
LYFDSSLIFWLFRLVRSNRPRPILPRFIVLQIQKETKLKNIFVGNLSFGATEAAVRSLFETYGTIDRVSIVTDRDTGQARGFGFVEMTNNAEGDQAIAGLNGRDLDGRALTVNEARPKAERGNGGGGGYGGQRRNNRY